MTTTWAQIVDGVTESDPMRTWSPDRLRRAMGWTIGETIRAHREWAKRFPPRNRRAKRVAVFARLNDPDWRRWSDREIARCTGVTHPTVQRLRREWEAGQVAV